MPTQTTKNASSDSITYTCEHVLATLMDDVMEGYHQYINYTTAQVLQYILDLQESTHWVLGDVDFNRYFHYSFENENGLLAPLLSIPKPFNEAYEFTFDTQVYPWVLNLKTVSNNVLAEVRWGKDLIDFSEVSDPTDIVNYIIPKGAAEGVNQITIESVNGGNRYLKDDESISKWGKHSYIWIDQRFENPESLMANAQALLDQWKEPKISFEINSVDLSVKSEYSQEIKVLNGVTRVLVEEKEYLARIIGETISDLSKEYEVKYQINNKLDDLSTTQADLERKQQVNEAYSQGATNIMNFGYQDNCDSEHPALIPFYIDDDVVNVNTCELTYRTKAFRAYSQATEGGGAVINSTASGGGSTQSSSSGGGTSTSTASGGGTSISSGAPNTMDFLDETRSTTGGPGDHQHNYEDAYWDIMDIQNHTHSVTLSSHTHGFTVPNHSHDVTIPNHAHDITLPDHTHDIDQGIYELETIPTTVYIIVDGNVVPITSANNDRVNLVDYMGKDGDGKITRGRHELQIFPDGLARIEADIILRVFIQSRLGGKY